MFLRKILIVVLFLFALSSSFAYKNVSSCQTINEAFLDAERLVKFNQTITNDDTTDCIIITASNFILNCQGNGVHTIMAFTTTAGITLSSVSNVTIENCYVFDYENGIEVQSSSNNLIYNSNFSNIHDDGILLSNSDNNRIIDCFLYDQGFRGIFIYSGSDNNTIRNIYHDNEMSLYVLGSNNTIDNLYGNFNTDLGFYSTARSNIVKNSYLGDFTYIWADNWSLIPATFIDNTYLDGTVPNPPCFDTPDNNICETSSPQTPTGNQRSSVSIFPAESFVSILLTLFLSFGYLMFN